MFCSFALRITIVTFCISSNGHAQAAREAAFSENVEQLASQFSFAAPTQGPSFAGTLIGQLIKFPQITSLWGSFKNLDYYADNELILQLPGTNQEAALTWGFKGSGNLFTALPSITINRRMITKSSTNQDFSKLELCKQFAVAALQDKLNQNAEKLPTFVKLLLTEEELKPGMLFGLKFIMLLKTTAEKPQYRDKFYAELMCLLYRLNLSDKFHIDKISSLLPEELTMLSPDLMNFVDELWIHLTSTTPLTVTPNEYSTKLGTNETIKAILLTFTRTLHDYMALKKEMLKNNKEYREQCEEQERKDNLIQDFITTDEGKESLLRLSQKITPISKALSMRQAIDKKNKLTTILNAKIKEQSKITNDLDIWENLKGIKKGNELKKVHANIHKFTTQKTALALEIDQEKAALAQLDEEIAKIEQSPELQLEQDKKNLNQLLVRANNLRNQGQTIPEQLATTITALKSKIEQATTNTQPQTIDFAARLAKREKAAKIFIDEATIMEQQLSEKQKAIQNITDKEQQVIEELLFDAHGYTTYINNLKQNAKRILDINDKANKLKASEKALAAGLVPKTSDILQKIQALKEQVGNAFTGMQEEDFMAKLVRSHSNFDELYTNLSTNEAFKSIKENLNTALTNIYKNSEHIQKNKSVYQTMITNFIPEFFPMLTPFANSVA